MIFRKANSEPQKCGPLILLHNLFIGSPTLGPQCQATERTVKRFHRAGSELSACRFSRAFGHSTVYIVALARFP